MRPVLPSAAMLLFLTAARLPALGPEFCESCHEIRPLVDNWKVSTHRNVPCTGCHEYSTVRNVQRAVAHMRGNVPEQPHVGMADLPAIIEKCKGCHQQQYAEWKAGPHGATYTRIFTNADHNRKRELMNDCFRCHGMHFEGSIGELVQPVDTRGPWRLVKPDMANAPAMPCMACHSMHSAGAPSSKPDQRSGLKQSVMKPSLALFDRRSRMAASARWLALPAMLDSGRAVKMSPDARQGLCYQCHAPLAANEVASGDDRTPVGVHEGLSCFACHQGHQQNTRASCATCHPRLSNCGIDVEKMDTTFGDPKSRHNVHTVKCLDCHPTGVPKRRERNLQ